MPAHAASAGIAAPAASPPCRNAGMYALKCANSVPQPTAPTTVDTANADVHNRNGLHWRGSSRRELGAGRRSQVYSTSTMVAATMIVSAGKCHRMLAYDFQNRSM